jgi:hypothetical protein
MKRIVSQISTSEAIHPRKAGIVAFILEFSHSLSNRRQCCIVKVDAPLVRPPPGLSRITTLLISFAVDIHTYPPPSTHTGLYRFTFGSAKLKACWLRMTVSATAQPLAGTDLHPGPAQGWHTTVVKSAADPVPGRREQHAGHPGSLLRRGIATS